jgi:DNA-binding protein HU-beta
MLSQRLSFALNVSTIEAQRIIKAFKSSLLEELKDRRSVILLGLGTFRIVERRARKGRNPQTGKEIKIPAHKTIVFRVSPKVKQVVNGKRKKK